MAHWDSIIRFSPMPYVSRGQSGEPITRRGHHVTPLGRLPHSHKTRDRTPLQSSIQKAVASV